MNKDEVRQAAPVSASGEAFQALSNRQIIIRIEGMEKVIYYIELMCRVSDKIKFCTCSASSTEMLKHYWVFHRFVEGKDHIVIGQPMFPYSIDDRTNNYNREQLLKRINKRDAFDTILNQREGDRLQISIQCGEGFNGYIHYGFSFNSCQWVEEEFDSLMWMWHHEESRFGKIRSALMPKQIQNK